MAAEQSIDELREIKARVERLICYYRELGEKELGFAEELELRLFGASEALRQGADSLSC